MARHNEFAEGKNKFIEPSKVPMPLWRTVLVILYTISLLLWGFVSGRVKKLFAPKGNAAIAKK
jgi:hypothetical protein